MFYKISCAIVAATGVLGYLALCEMTDAQSLVGVWRMDLGKTLEFAGTPSSPDSIRILEEAGLTYTIAISEDGWLTMTNHRGEEELAGNCIDKPELRSANSRVMVVTNGAGEEVYGF